MTTVADRMLEVMRARVGEPIDFKECASEVGIRTPYPEDTINVHITYARRRLLPHERIVSSYGQHKRGHAGTYTLVYVSI